MKKTLAFTLTALFLLASCGNVLHDSVKKEEDKTTGSPSRPPIYYPGGPGGSSLSRPLNNFVVTFDPNGATNAASLRLSPQSVAAGGRAASPGNAVKPPHVRFNGWFYGNMLWDFNRFGVVRDMELRADWDLILYTLTYDVNSTGKVGTPSLVPAAASIESGTAVEPPTPPVLPGYDFSGWYKDAACTNAWNFSSELVTADVTLYAKWTPLVYRIRYDTGASSEPAADSYTIETAVTTIAPPAASSGRVFKGWYTDAARTVAVPNPAIPVGSRGDRIFYAKFLNKVTDTNLTGTIVAPKAGNRPEGINVNSAQYTCGNVYWRNASTYTEQTGPFAGSVIYEAVFTLTANAGWTFEGVSGFSFTGGAVASPNYSSDYTSVTITIAFSAIDVPPPYDVSFIINPASLSATFTGIPADYTETERNKKIPRPSPTPTISMYTPSESIYYVFGGWYREAGCISPWNFDTDIVRSDVTLYAKWTDWRKIYNKTDWDTAVGKIKNTYKSNYTHDLTLMGSFSIPGVSSPLFGGGTNLLVNIFGNVMQTLTLSSNGAAIYIGNRQTVTLYPTGGYVTIIGKAGNNSPVVYVASGGTFNMQGGFIKGNQSSNHGGGVYLTGGTFYMTGASQISDNSTKWPGNGGGVYAYNSTITMNGDSSIKNNNAAKEGGGLFLEGGSSVLRMQNNSAVTGNTAGTTETTDGGGGVTLNGAKLYLESGSINNNLTSGQTGGGVFNYQGTFEMSGGQIFGNRVTHKTGNGGGVSNYGTFRKTSGTIYGKEAGAYANQAAGNASGHAVFSNTSNRWRDTTTTGGDILNSGDAINWNR